MTREHTTEAAPLTLTVRSLSQPTIGGGIEVEVTLRNTSQTPVLVNGRMLVDEASGLAGYHELEPILVGPDGEPLPFLLDVGSTQAQAGDLIELAPHQALTRKVSLGHYFRVSQPGAHQLRLAYRNDLALTRDRRSAFVGRVEADPITIEVAQGR